MKHLLADDRAERGMRNGNWRRRLYGRRARAGMLGMDIDGGLLVCEPARESGAVCKRAAWIGREKDAPPPTADSGPEEQAQHFVDALREAVAKNAWRGFRVAVAVPLEHIALRHVALPRMPKRALRTALAAELERRIHLPFDDPLYDFHVQQQADGAQSGELGIIVVAAPRQEVMPWVRLCADAGLRPVAVEPALLGMARVLARDGVSPDAGPPGVDVLVSLGWGGVGMGVMRGSDLVFMRHIAVRPADYGRDAADGHDSGDAYAADVGHELDRSLAFIQYNFLRDGQAVRRVLLFDKVGAFHRVAAVLRDRVDFPVEQATPSFTVDDGCAAMLSRSGADSRAIAAQVAAAAFGLAAREVLP